MTPEERGYLAGLFEGEGSVVKCRMQIGMTDLEPLERVRSIVGGVIRGPYTRADRPTHKPWYSWRLHGYDNLQRVLDELRPLLTERRCKQFEAAIASRATPRTHCKRGHEYTEENTRVVKGGRVCRACARQKTKDRYHADIEASRAYQRSRRNRA